jgi:hypothetical protein
MKGKPKSEQLDKFEEAARALECDESEERFDAALKKVAVHKPPKDHEDVALKGRIKPSKTSD